VASPLFCICLALSHSFCSYFAIIPWPQEGQN
jgi:hypothetical protein